MTLSKFIRDIPHVIWVLLFDVLLLWAYVYTRDEAIKNLLITGVGAFFALSKAAQSSLPTQQVDAQVRGDLVVEQPKTGGSNV